MSRWKSFERALKVMGVGVGCMFVAPIFGFGPPLYIGDVFGFAGIAVTFVMALVIIVWHIVPAIDKLIERALGIQ